MKTAPRTCFAIYLRASPREFTALKPPLDFLSNIILPPTLLLQLPPFSPLPYLPHPSPFPLPYYVHPLHFRLQACQPVSDETGEGSLRPSNHIGQSTVRLTGPVALNDEELGKKVKEGLGIDP